MLLCSKSYEVDRQMCGSTEMKINRWDDFASCFSFACILAYQGCIYALLTILEVSCMPVEVKEESGIHLLGPGYQK